MYTKHIFLAVAGPKKQNALLQSMLLAGTQTIQCPQSGPSHLLHPLDNVGYWEHQQMFPVSSLLPPKTQCTENSRTWEPRSFKSFESSPDNFTPRCSTLKGPRTRRSRGEVCICLQIGAPTRCCVLPSAALCHFKAVFYCCFN